jgi:hypothetical protein
MRRLTLAALAAVLCLPATAVMAAQKLPTPVRVDGGAKLKWLVRPDVMQISAIVTDFGSGVGQATIECTLSDGGRAKDCAVIEAEGNNYGPMVIKLVSRYRAASKDADGVSTAGVKIRFTFNGGDSKDL